MGPGFERIRPAPASCWVCWAPRAWRGPRAPFLDLARGRLAGAALRRGGGGKRIPTDPVDTLYLPPVAPQDRDWRAAWIERARGAGFPVVAQLLPGDPRPAEASLTVFDLTSALLARELDRLDDLEEGARVVWPLIAGLTDDRELQVAVCRRLRRAGVVAVQVIVPELAAEQRRELSELGGPEAYHALFHGPAPRRVDLVRAIVGSGFEPWLPRPERHRPSRWRGQRRLAEHLAVLGEWWLLLDRPEGSAQALFRAARWIDSEKSDVLALARDGDLAIVEGLEPSCRRAIERFAAGGADEALAELEQELLAG